MDPEIIVEIGGVTVAVRCPPGGGVSAPPGPYRDFVTGGEPQAWAEIHCGPAPAGRRRLIFRAGPNWSLYRQGEKRVIETMTLAARCDPDFRRLDIHPRRPGGPPPGFFTYPLPELLLINLLARGGDGLLVHAAGVADRGRGFLFCGMSGAGKSTLARLWAGEGACVLNDDRIVVRGAKPGFAAFGTPWHGEAGFRAAVRTGLDGIFFIEHGSQNRARPLRRSTAAALLLGRSFPPLWDKGGMTRTLEFADHLCRSVPCFRLEFMPGQRAVELVRSL